MAIIETCTVPTFQPDPYLAAYERCLGEITRVPTDQLTAINLDIVQAVTTVRGAVPKIMRFRDQMTNLPGIDVSLIDKLEDYAAALFQAQTVYRRVSTPSADLPAMAEKATEVREILWADLNAFVQRGLIKAELLRGVKTQNGYKALAADVQILVNLFRDHWAVIEGNSAVRAPELDAAASLSYDIIGAVAQREQASEKIAVAAERRGQIYTLFHHAYSEARRVITFLRWHEGDAETIATSLYAGRGGRKKEEEPASERPAAAAATDPAVSAPAAQAARPGLVGTPDADPFAAV